VPTAATGTNTTQAASTAFVASAVAAGGGSSGAADTFPGTNYVSGYYYGPTNVKQDTTSQNVTIREDSSWFMFVRIYKAVSVSGLSFYCSSGFTNATVRLAMYKVGANANTASLIAGTTVTSPATVSDGVYNPSFSSAVSLTPGFYLIGVQATAQRPGLRAFNAGGYSNMDQIGAPSPSTMYGFPATTGLVSYNSFSYTYSGGLPSTVTFSDGDRATNSPLVLFKTA
jgi:hypothetical protein